MESREDYYRRKYTCRYCLFKSTTLVQMHERTCKQNPNRSAYIAKRYGVGHVSGVDVCAMVKAHQAIAETTASQLVNHDPTLNTVDIKQQPAKKSRTRRQSTKSKWDNVTVTFYPLDSTFTLFTPITNGPLPILTGDDVTTVFESL